MSEAIYTQGQYLENNPTWHIEDSVWKAEQIVKIIQKNNLQPSWICEVGCGSGEILNQLYQNMPNNVKLVGYEISPQAYQLCQERIQDRLNFKFGNLLQEETIDFDLLLCIDVLEQELFSVPTQFVLSTLVFLINNSIMNFIQRVKDGRCLTWRFEQGRLRLAPSGLRIILVDSTFDVLDIS